jgi:hypothetical protein
VHANLVVHWHVTPDIQLQQAHQLTGSHQPTLCSVKECPLRPDTGIDNLQGCGSPFPCLVFSTAPKTSTLVPTTTSSTTATCRVIVLQRGSQERLAQIKSDLQQSQAEFFVVENAQHSRYGTKQPQRTGAKTGTQCPCK